MIEAREERGDFGDAGGFSGAGDFSDAIAAIRQSALQSRRLRALRRIRVALFTVSGIAWALALTGMWLAGHH